MFNWYWSSAVLGYLSANAYLEKSYVTLQKRSAKYRRAMPEATTVS